MHVFFSFQDLTKISPNYDPSKQSTSVKGDISQKLSSSLSASLNGKTVFHIYNTIWMGHSRILVSRFLYPM